MARWRPCCRDFDIVGPRGAASGQHRSTSRCRGVAAAAAPCSPCALAPGRLPAQGCCASARAGGRPVPRCPGWARARRRRSALPGEPAPAPGAGAAPSRCRAAAAGPDGLPWGSGALLQPGLRMPCSSAPAHMATGNPERASSLSCQDAPLFQICQRSVISCGRFPPPRSLPLPLEGDSCDLKGLAARPDVGHV